MANYRLAMHQLIFILLIVTQGYPVRGVTFNTELDEDDAESSAKPRTVAQLSDYVTGSILDSMRFEIDRHSSPVANYFTVNARTGQLATFGNGSLDRDSLCQQVRVCCQRSLVCKLRLRIRLIDSVNVDGTKSIWASINLRDLNDNSPTFLLPEYNLTVEEGGPIGENLRLPQAVDTDSDEFGIREYILAEPNAFFQVTQSDLNGQKEPRLTVLKDIDREQTPSFNLKLLAKDGGSPPRTGSTQIRIRIVDRNDNAPVFTRDRVSVSLREDTLPGSHVAQLNATDADEGENAAIRYSLRDTSMLPGQPGGTGNFYINPMTGLVTLRQPLDYEKSQRHVLIVEAVDRAVSSSGYSSSYASRHQTPRTGSATLTVNVVDVNDEPPRIVLASPNADGSLSVDENDRPDTLVAWVTVGDGDRSSSRHVSCRLTGPGREQFRLATRQNSEEHELELRTVHQLDAEQAREQRLAISCTDAGVPPLTAQKELRVRINNLNDNRPSFGIRTLNLTIPENRGGNLFVFEFNATDRDGDRVLYTLEDTPDRFYFRLNSSGRLYAVSSFDREQTNRYHLRVTARDTGEPPLESDPLDVIVNIADLNDNSPVFRDVLDSAIGIRFSVNEECKPGTFVGQVRADDADTGANGRVRYNIAEYSSQKCFSVHPETGVIQTACRLDREKDSRHTFRVQATDGGVPRLSASVLVTVEVTDINDNPPRFIYPGADNTTVETSFRNAVGTTVAEIRVMDPDEDQNSVIEYAITGGSGMSMFRIDQKTGNLMLDRPLTRANIGSYSLLLQVSDSGYPSQSATASLIVLVKDIPADKRHLLLSSDSQPVGSGGGGGVGGSGGQFPPSVTRRRNNSAASIGQRNLVLIVCLVIMASLLAFVFLAVIAWLRRRQRAEEAGGISGTIGGAVGEAQSFKHYPTLPLMRAPAAATAGETLGNSRDAVTVVKGQTLKLNGAGGCGGGGGHGGVVGGPAATEINTYYRIPASDESYEKNYVISAMRHKSNQLLQQDLSPIDMSEQLNQLHGYQILQQQHQQQQQPAAPLSLTSSPCAVDRMGRTGKRQQTQLHQQSKQQQQNSKSFNLVTSSFV